MHQISYEVTRICHWHVLGLVFLGLTTPLQRLLFWIYLLRSVLRAIIDLDLVCLVWLFLLSLLLLLYVNTNQSCWWRVGDFTYRYFLRERVREWEREREKEEFAKYMKRSEKFARQNQSYHEIKYKDQGIIETGRLSGWKLFVVAWVVSRESLSRKFRKGF